MTEALFDTSRLAEVVVRTVVVYLGLLLALRLAGKREVGQMKPFDLVTLLILSNAVQNAMVGADSSLVGGLAAASVILLANAGVGALRGRFALARDLFEGSPTVVVNGGHFVAANLRAEGISEADVLQSMREHGVEDVARVTSAVLEVDGTISIIQKDGAAITRTRRRIHRPGRR